MNSKVDGEKRIEKWNTIKLITALVLKMVTTKPNTHNVSTLWKYAHGKWQKNGLFEFCGATCKSEHSALQHHLNHC